MANKIDGLRKDIQEVKNICKEHNYLDKIVVPYGYPVKIRDFIRPWDDLRDSYGLRLRDGFIFREVRGLLKTLRSWAEFDNEPKVRVEFLQGENAGTTKEVQRSLAETFEKINFARMV